MHRYIVTRQQYWHETEAVVEIATGGTDCVSPDALSARFADEFCEFDCPVEAAQAAIKIGQAWSLADDLPVIYVLSGSVMVTPTVQDGLTAQELMVWSAGEQAALPKCDGFTGTLTPEFWQVEDYDGKFCSEYCADNFYYDSLMCGACEDGKRKCRCDR